ncbi:MAG: CDGSH iron-sulfur domain-containing protein [Nevskiaceae bacterium]|nr:MAG: CDGSH iron-sulfur domain-containing protein [Nevskiaceae bacterium]
MADHDVPHIPQRKPYMLELAPGEYLWCACGRSARQPFCDGAHAGSGIEPVRFSVRKRSETVWLCGCKHTRTPPFCDGRHNRL